MHSQPLGSCPQACTPDLKHPSVLQKQGEYTATLSLLQKFFFNLCRLHSEAVQTSVACAIIQTMLLHVFSNYPTSVGTEGQQTILDKYFCHFVLDN